MKALLLQTNPWDQKIIAEPHPFTSHDRETEARRGGEFPKVPSKSKPLAHCPSPGTHLALLRAAPCHPACLPPERAVQA